MAYFEQTEDNKTWPLGFDQYGNPYGFEPENEEEEIIQFDNQHQNKK